MTTRGGSKREGNEGNHMQNMVARLQGEVLYLRKQLQRRGKDQFGQQHPGVRVDSRKDNQEEEDGGDDEEDVLSMTTQIVADQLSVAPTIIMQGKREEEMHNALETALYVMRRKILDEKDDG